MFTGRLLNCLGLLPRVTPYMSCLRVKKGVKVEAWVSLGPNGKVVPQGLAGDLEDWMDIVGTRDSSSRKGN